LASRGTCGFFGGAVSAVRGLPCAPSGEPVLFRRSCLCWPLCEPDGDLCPVLLSRGCRPLCAVCSSFGSRRCAVRVPVAVPLCPRQELLADASCRSCSAVLAPRVGAFHWHHRLALSESLLCPVVSYLRPLVPLMCQLRWFCSRCFVVDWPGSSGVAAAAAGVTKGPSLSRFVYAIGCLPASRRCRMENDDPASDLFDRLTARLAMQLSVSSERS